MINLQLALKSLVDDLNEAVIPLPTYSAFDKAVYARDFTDMLEPVNLDFLTMLYRKCAKGTDTFNSFARSLVGYTGGIDLLLEKRGV